MVQDEASVRRTRAARWWTAALCGLGALTSGYLLWVHATVRSGAAADSGLCRALGDGFACAPAATSSYAMLLGLPIALWALGFYIAVAAGALLTPQLSRFRGNVSGLAVFGFAAACLYSLILGWVSLTQLDAVCPGCLLLYAVNGAGLASSWLWLGAGPWAAVGRLWAHKHTLVAQPALWSMVGVAVVTMAAGQALLAWQQPGATGPSAQQAAAVAQQFRQQPVVEAPELRASGVPSKGPRDAPVAIVEFSDFQCPYCARLSQVLARLHRRFPQTLRIEYRHLPLPIHAHAETAARASICAAQQDKFWPLHDVFFANHHTLDPKSIRRLAGEVGLEPAWLTRCMRSERTDAKLARDARAANALGLRGSPSFFVNGRLFVGARPYRELEKIVKAARREAETTMSASP